MLNMIALRFVCERGGMVDALSSGGSERMLVRVQVPPFALVKKAGIARALPLTILAFCANIRQLYCNCNAKKCEYCTNFYLLQATVM